MQTLRLLSATALVFTHACALATTSSGARDAVRLEIRNERAQDMTVYLDRAGALIRIGTVNALRQRSFLLNNAQVGSGSELRLVAEVRGSRERQRSQLFVVEAGQQILFTLRHGLAFGSAVVR